MENKNVLKEKAILIKCVDREISAEIFDSVNLAYEAMEHDLAKEMETEVPDDHDWDVVECACRYDDFDIDYDSAYYTGSEDYDWKIMKIQIKE